MSHRLAIWSPGFDPTDGGVQRLSLDVRTACQTFVDTSSLALGGKSTLPKSSDKLLFLVRAIRNSLVHPPTSIVVMHRGLLLPAAWVRLAFPNLRLFCWLHGTEAWSAQKRFSDRFVDCFLGSSRTTLERSKRWLPSSVRSRAVHPSVDFTRFCPGPADQSLLSRLGLASCPELFLTVARLPEGSARKGHEVAFRAFAKVLRKHPQARYLVVGNGPGRRGLETLAGSLGIAGQVVFAGRVEEKELCEYYRLAKVFAMPSDGEGFGIAWIEAIASGCHVIAGDGDAATETLCGGQLGRCLPPNDPEVLAHHMAECLGLPVDPSCRNRAKALYDQPRFAAEIKEILQGTRNHGL